MDLNERLAARRKELAEEKDRVIREAEQQRQAEEATRQAARAEAAAMPIRPDPLGMQTPAKKTVNLDLDGQVISASSGTHHEEATGDLFALWLCLRSSV